MNSPSDDALCPWNTSLPHLNYLLKHVVVMFINIPLLLNVMPSMNWSVFIIVKLTIIYSDWPESGHEEHLTHSISYGEVKCKKKPCGSFIIGFRIWSSAICKYSNWYQLYWSTLQPDDYLKELCKCYKRYAFFRLWFPSWNWSLCIVFQLVMDDVACSDPLQRGGGKMEMRKRAERYKGMRKPVCSLETCCVRLSSHYHADGRERLYFNALFGALHVIQTSLSLQRRLCIIYHLGCCIILFSVKEWTYRTQVWLLSCLLACIANLYFNRFFVCMIVQTVVPAKHYKKRM